MNAPARGELVVVSAPSGAGKSTLVARLMAEVPRLAFSVSWTTRAPRPGEIDGAAYHFTDQATFRRKVDAGDFLEWAEVHGNLYGTARAETDARLAQGDDLLLDIDVQGAALVRATGYPCHTVFILPPDAPTLAARLSGRGTERADAFARRMANAALEVRRWAEFDHVVINDDLDGAAQDLVAIVRALRTRRDRRAAAASAVAATFAAGGTP